MTQPATVHTLDSFKHCNVLINPKVKLELITQPQKKIS